MTIEKATTNQPRMLGIIKHTLAAFIAGYPLFIGIYLWIINPDYMQILILPESNSQAMGWIMVFTILLAIVSTYALVIVLCNILISLSQPQAQKRIAMKVLEIFLLILCIYGLRALAILITVLGPATLMLWQSPVGRMFFGS